MLIECMSASGKRLVILLYQHEIIKLVQEHVKKCGKFFGKNVSLQVSVRVNCGMRHLGGD